MKKTCYYIGPLGEKNSLTRAWTENILEFLIKPVITKLGYKLPKLIDSYSDSAMFSFETIRHLTDENLVIVDLTEGDPVVFYQMAILHVLQKPVIHIIRKGDRTPFDLKEINVISVRTDDLNLMENARSELRRIIVMIEKGDYTRISYVETLKQVTGLVGHSDSILERDMLLNIYEKIDEIRSSVLDLKREVYDVSNQISGFTRKSLRSSTFIDKRLAKAELMRRRTGGN